MSEHNHGAEPSESDPTAGYDPTASSLSGRVAPEVMAELLSVRSSIDNIDATLVYLLAERFKATQRVGFLKARHQLPPADPGREAAQIARLRRLAAEAELDPAFAEKFLNFIISEVIRHHEAISKIHGDNGAERNGGDTAWNDTDRNDAALPEFDAGDEAAAVSDEAAAAAAANDDARRAAHCDR